MDVDDLPMISEPFEDAPIPLSPQKEKSMSGPEPRSNPTTQVPKTAPPPAAQDPRKASEARKPGTVSPTVRPASAETPATRPVAAAPAPRPAAVPERSEEEDPEKLLREYAERQKTKVLRLEQQLVEYKKVVVERDSLRAKAEALARELVEAKRQLEHAAKADEVIKDLQGKVDAAVLSNSIISDDKEKLKKALSTQTENLKRSEDRATAAEKSLVESQKNLSQQLEARKAAEERILAARAALEGAAGPSTARPAPEKHASEMATRPIETPSAPAPAAQGDPRKASEARRDGSVVPTKPVARPALAPSARPAVFPRR